MKWPEPWPEPPRKTSIEKAIAYRRQAQDRSLERIAEALEHLVVIADHILEAVAGGAEGEPVNFDDVQYL